MTECMMHCSGFASGVWWACAYKTTGKDVAEVMSSINECRCIGRIDCKDFEEA